MLREVLRHTASVASVFGLPRRSDKQKPLLRAVRAAVEALECRTLLSAGDLDPTFGNNGVVLLPAAGYLAFASTVQSDGKIVIVGSNFFVERLNPDGSPDTSFGSGGIQIEPFANSAVANAVAIQSNGKIVVAGTETFSNGNTEFAFERLNANGTLDTTFGNGGFAEAGVTGNQRAQFDRHH